MSSAPPAGSSPPSAPDTAAAAQTSPSKRPTIKPMTQSAFTPGREPQPATEGAGEPEPHDTTAPPPTATAASGAIPPWLAVQAAPEDVEAAAQLRTIIPMIHPAMIGAVLQSLVDDIPKLAPIVRSRCEVAMSLTNAAVNAAAATMPSPFGGGSSSPYFPNAPFLNPAAAAFNAIAHQQQLAAMAAAQAAAHGDHLFGGGPHPYGSGNTTPSGHRRPSQPQPPRGAMSPSVAGRGLPPSEIGETDVCAIHNAVRSRKHLHINPVTRQKECVHGFHCLETNSNFQTPTKAAARDASAPTGTGSNPPTPIASAAPKAAPVAPMDDAEVKRLQDLLSTVRQTQQSS